MCSPWCGLRRRTIWGQAMKIHIRARKNALLVRAGGHLTETTASELLEQIEQELRPAPRNVILDLTAVESMSAGALPYVFRIQRRAGATANRFILAGRSAAVQRLLEATKVAGALEHARDETEAARTVGAT